MNHFDPSACKCALFKCTACNHTTEIYTTEEWLRDSFPFGEFEDINSSNKDKFTHSCDGCGSLTNPTFAVAYAFRSDEPTNGYPYGLSLSRFPDSRCQKCIGSEKAYWTETIFYCFNCEDDFLIFINYIDGTYMQVFKEMITRWQKEGSEVIKCEENKIYFWLNSPKY